MAQTIGHSTRATGATGAARHRRDNWPRNMVPLEQFGQPAPPPPHPPLDWRRVARNTLIAIAVLVVLAVPIYFGQQAAKEYWSRTSYLDMRLHPGSAPALIVSDWGAV